MPKVTFLPDGTEVEVREGLSLFAAAIEADAAVESQCGGRGGCALCRVIIREGTDNLSPMEWEEQAHLGNVFHVTHERLACQSRVRGDVVVEIPEPIERNKKPYVPHRFRRNLEQQVQARMQAAEVEQDSLRSVKGKTRRRRRRGRGRGPLESTGEIKAVSASVEAVSSEQEAAPTGPAEGDRPRTPESRKPEDGEGQRPRGRRRSRRRRRPRRRRGGGGGSSGSAKGDGQGG